MKHTQSDGFPITFNFHDAARFSAITSGTLRSYFHRNLLRHVGQTPLAGQERRFTMTGVIEIALLERFADSGLPLTLASQYADAVLRQSFASALASQYADDAVLRQSFASVPPEALGKKFSLVAYVKIIHDKSVDLSLFDMNPRYFIEQPMWSHRDQQTPFVVLASERISGGVVSSEVTIAQSPDVTDLATGDVVVHVLNLTRLMTSLEAAIEARA